MALSETLTAKYMDLATVSASVAEFQDRPIQPLLLPPQTQQQLNFIFHHQNSTLKQR